MLAARRRSSGHCEVNTIHILLCRHYSRKRTSQKRTAGIENYHGLCCEETSMARVKERRRSVGAVEVWLVLVVLEG
jgi:hypothetical protein